MRFLPKTVRGAAAALVMVAAGCASGTPAAGPASAPQVAAIAHTGAVAASPVRPAFVASLTPAKAGRGGDRLALLSSRTGALLRWLTPQPQGASDEVLSGRDGGANNWPPGITSLTWAPDDVHLAVQFCLTAAINSVLVFDAFTAATAGAGRTAPAPCTVSDVCAEFDPAYLASGALSYVIQRVSPSGVARASLVAWQAGRRTTLLSFPAGAPSSYGMTARGQAIWVDSPVRPKGPWLTWRWSGGAPVRIGALPPPGAAAYYGVGAIAW